MCRLAAVALFAVSVGCASPDPPGLSGPHRDLSGVAGADDMTATSADLSRARDLALGGGDGGTTPMPDLMAVTTDMASGCSTAQHPVINEVQTGGSSSTSDEFIEIYNPCALQVDLTGWKLVYRSASGVTDVLVATIGKPIGGNGYNLVASSVFSGGVAADETYTGGHLAAAGGGLALRNLNMGIVDSVGWGTATNAFIEGAVASAPAGGQSLARTPNGTDTDHNNLDFKIATTPTPKATN